MIEGIQRLYRMVVGVVGIGAIRRTDDSGDQQLSQINIRKGGPSQLEEVIDDVPRLGQYGLAYCPPDGSEAIVLFLGGRRSSGVTIATGFREMRPKDLEPGEVMLFNALAETFVKLSADGKIMSKGDWQHDGDLTTTGQIRDNAPGNTATVEDLRDTYNTHDHPETGGTTSPPNQSVP